MAREIRYPTLEQVERLHDRILELTGGEPGHLSKSNLEYLLEAVKSIGERLEKRKAIVKKATYLLHNLVTLHPFINGNKRTALELVRLFLRLNGYNLEAKPDEVYTLLAGLAGGKLARTSLDKWIETNLAEAKDV